ncbi:MAG: type II toxin-antitoxin system VapC family toxin [Acidobacteria bacterium]|nr:type II toxin-antitoxin system VapC family toxin [Acidobacteriota bacterium]
MERFVVDNSVVMAWGLDESSRYADVIMDLVSEAEVLVPGIWPLEFANALLVAERRKRLSEAESMRLKELVLEIPITVVSEPISRILSDILALARKYGISCYDASYLDLAMREAVPLATIDNALREAARRCRVTVMKHDRSRKA